MTPSKIITVGIVEDHAMTRNEMARILEQIGFKVTIIAENGNDLLEKLKISSLIPDVCLLDINMPVMDGFRTAKELSSTYPRMKILGNSINEDEEHIIKMLKSGACGYFIKGDGLQTLKNAIESCHSNGYYFNKKTAKVVLQFLMKGSIAI